ncbi:putative phage protein gp47/JayE [Ruminiclostridium sufflavum DSM 19573]|uniref:Putative phage protein gp47/JayE n=1 Tax=Ruminiclostridium sufflavum DSM 19573 TaxID=1121337 RepID=A0A318XHT3_9FIRM|nr:baseplate J/gp47 family protein [Ruminiclostridium sufflavum]PYG86745.1 putative phage protein gp47/JayE [Ruminiclostridium sufflavum DSM 19573]
MIDKEILDEIIPLPDIEELKEEKISELENEGFVITNFSSGGVFYTLLMIALQIRIEFITLLRSVLNNMFVSHAEGTWLKLKAADFSKKQKEAVKTQGYVTVTRGDNIDAVKIPKGHVFKTIKDIQGEELRFFVVKDTVLQKDLNTVEVLVEAEQEGAKYNVPPRQITRSLTYLDGGCTVLNGSDWIEREGSDIEDIESLRERTLRSWSELATRPIAEKYQNVCEAIPGVLFAKVNDLHPRGQGTVDIVITSTAGEATESLLEQVRSAISKIVGTYDDVLVKSSTNVEQPISVTVTIPSNITDENISNIVTAALIQLLKISKDRNLNELTHADIIYAVKGSASYVRNVKVTIPSEDIFLENDKVIVLGEISLTVERA